MSADPVFQFRQLVREFLVSGQLFAHGKRKARTTRTLASTATGLFKTLASIIAPCSVKTHGNFRRPPCELDVANCDFKFVNSCLFKLKRKIRPGTVRRSV